MTTRRVTIDLTHADALTIVRCARRGVRHDHDAAAVARLIAALDGLPVDAQPLPVPPPSAP